VFFEFNRSFARSQWSRNRFSYERIGDTWSADILVFPLFFILLRIQMYASDRPYY
jgi:hypothetical protein